MTYKPVPIKTKGGRIQAVVSEDDVVELLQLTLKEARITNAYLREIVGEKITEEDIET